jgi:hypothetical protein
MRCPHCTTDFHENWYICPIERIGQVSFIVPINATDKSVFYWHYRTTICSKCKDGITYLRERLPNSSFRNILFLQTQTRSMIPLR